MKRILTLTLVAVAALAAAGGASAAIPAGDGQISACKTKDGSIKLIDKEAGQNCPGNQQLIEWNQQGPAGQDGLDGEDGQDGVSGYERVSTSSDLDSSGDKTVWAFCPAGKSVLGGGAGVYGEYFDGGQVIIDGVALVQNHPFNSYGWSARASEFEAVDDAWQLHVWAICADV